MPRRNPGQSHEHAIESLRQTIAAKLRIEPERLKFGPLPGVEIGMRGTAGDHWQIHYRGEWRELPWHPEYPEGVTRDHVRLWHGIVKKEAKEQN